jgi:hypothetical protein
VTLEAEVRSGFVELHVRDDGSGFATDFLSHAWERFARASPTRDEQGAGLGLPIVRAIAAAHGGHADARNILAGGADLWVALPRVLQGDIGTANNAPVRHPIADHSDGGPDNTHRTAAHRPRARATNGTSSPEAAADRGGRTMTRSLGWATGLFFCAAFWLGLYIAAGGPPPW